MPLANINRLQCFSDQGGLMLLPQLCSHYKTVFGGTNVYIGIVDENIVRFDKTRKALNPTHRAQLDAILRTLEIGTLKEAGACVSLEPLGEGAFKYVDQHRDYVIAVAGELNEY